MTTTRTTTSEWNTDIGRYLVIGNITGKSSATVPDECIRRRARSISVIAIYLVITLISEHPPVFQEVRWSCINGGEKRAGRVKHR